MQYPEFEGEPEADFAEIPSFRQQDFDDFDGESVQSEGSDERDEITPAPAPEPRHQPYVAVPEFVKQFVSYFYRHIKDRNLYDIQAMYENGFNKITEKYFKQSPWPMADSIAPLLNNGKISKELQNERSELFLLPSFLFGNSI